MFEIHGLDEKSAAFMRKREAANAYRIYSFIEPRLVEPDHSVVVMNIHPENLNPFGMVHGGAICTLADNASGVAAHSDGRKYVTQASSYNYISNQGSGRLKAEGKVVHRGRRTVVVDVTITGENEKLIATAAFTMFCVGDGKEEV